MNWEECPGSGDVEPVHHQVIDGYICHLGYMGRVTAIPYEAPPEGYGPFSLTSDGQPCSLLDPIFAPGKPTRGYAFTSEAALMKFLARREETL